MRVGRLNAWVALSRPPVSSPDSDGFFEALSPANVWAAIEPQAPGSGDGRALTHVVTLRYHAGVNLDTRIVTTTGRELFVRGVQNVGDRNVELRLLCEEVLP